MIYVLLVVFQIKHFVSDFPFQNSYMLRKFLPGKEFILPLTLHCLVHATFTYLVTLGVTSNLKLSFLLSLLDFTIHFIMDRIKASPKLLGRFKALTAKEYATATNKQKEDNKLFWWSLGIDQMVHHLTHYVLIYLILRG